MGTVRRELVIAVAVILLELIGGMQAYLSQLILPIMATDLHARASYGIIMGVSTLASMVGLPIGAWLMTRLRLPRLLFTATLTLVMAAIISATAQHLTVYLLGSAVRSLAGAILAMTSIGAVALGLSGKGRQLTLAFSSASWVVSSIVGPSYAAWATHVLSWRWAMVLYLPLLLLARAVIALNLKSEGTRKDAPFSYKALVLILIGVTLTILPSSGIIKVLLLLAGTLVLGVVAVIMMPARTFTVRTPRRAALAGMLFLTGAYFSANELIGLTAHDIFDAGPSSLGTILMAGGLAWALIGVYCGMKPARTRARYRLRSLLGLGLIWATAVFMALWSLLGWSLPASVLLVALWAIAGLGMGFVYLDTLNIFFDDPITDDGISIEEMASSSVIVESLASTMFVPMIASLVSLAFTSQKSFSGMPYSIAWFLVAALAVLAFMYLRHAEPAEPRQAH